MLAIMISLAGLVASAILLNEHLRIAGGSMLWSQACTADGRFDCDSALTSEWGQVRGIPTAMLGFAFFSFTTAWFFVVGRPSGEARGWHLVAVLATAIGAGACGWLAYVMYVKLEVICRFCAATHIFAGLLFLVTLTLWPRRPHAVVTQVAIPDKLEPVAVLVPVPDSPTFRMVAGALLFAAALTVVGVAEYGRRMNESYRVGYEAFANDFQTVTLSFTAQPQVDIPIDDKDHVRGPADAPHTIVVFSDFQCPVCRQLARMLDKLGEKFPGRFRLVFKHFPLNKECNPHAKGNAHAAACPAAQVAEAAAMASGEEAFWTVHDRLFEDFNAFAKGPSTKFVIDLSKELGVETADFWKVIGGDDVKQRIVRDTDVAAGLGVNATPAVYCDGRKVNGWINEKFWELILTPPPAARPASRPATATAPETE